MLNRLSIPNYNQMFYLIIAIELPYLERRLRDGGEDTICLGLHVVHDVVR